MLCASGHSCLYPSSAASPVLMLSSSSTKTIHAHTRSWHAYSPPSFGPPRPHDASRKPCHETHGLPHVQNAQSHSLHLTKPGKRSKPELDSTLFLPRISNIHRYAWRRVATASPAFVVIARSRSRSSDASGSAPSRAHCFVARSAHSITAIVCKKW